MKLYFINKIVKTFLLEWLPFFFKTSNFFLKESEKCKVTAALIYILELDIHYAD